MNKKLEIRNTCCRQINVFLINSYELQIRILGTSTVFNTEYWFIFIFEAVNSTIDFYLICIIYEFRHLLGHFRVIPLSTLHANVFNMYIARRAREIPRAPKGLSGRFSER